MTETLRRTEAMREEKATVAELVRPFGPGILIDQVSQELVDTLNRAGDRVLGDPELRKRWDWSHKLAGNVDGEVLVVFESVEERERTLAELKEKCLLYFNLLREQDRAAARGRPGETRDVGLGDLEFAGMWLVNQRAGDFNPCHHHGADFSSVLYLRLPPDMEAEWAAEDHYPSAGTIEFLDGRPSPYSRSTYRLRPRIGTLLIFPAWLPHMVYPFRSAGERRSMSFNMFVKPPSG
jgi:hypothetical protein